MISRRLSAAALFAVLWAFAAFVAPGMGPVEPALAQFADQANTVTAAGGTANAQTGTLANATTYSDVQNVVLTYTPAATNIGATTFTLNGFGSSPEVRKPTSGGLVSLTGQELVNGVPALIQYNGTYFVIMSTNTAQAPIAAPQGYLTPCNFANSPSVTGCTAGVTLPTADVTGAAAMYYQPIAGNQVPIYNGSAFVSTTFSELTLTLGSTNVANTIYDVVVFNNAGVPAIGTSVAWTSSTSGSGSRGTGAGSAQITLLDGVWVNAVSISAKNGAGTFSVPANQATVVGSLLIDGTNGQVTFHRTYGQNRRWAAFNFYNQQDLYLKAGDGTSTWTYATGTIRQSNGAAGNTLALFATSPVQSAANLKFTQQTNIGSNTGGSPRIGIGINSTTAMTGQNILAVQASVNTGSINAALGVDYSEYLYAPSLGRNDVNSLEVGTSSMTFYGTESSMVLSARWRG